MSTAQKTNATIHFATKLFTIGDWLILRLPDNASAELPSRGQVMVEGTINGAAIRTPLEPDGNFRHWLHIDDKLSKTIGVHDGDTVTVAFTATKDWIEPEVPADIMKAVVGDPPIHELWQQITPMARWEWIRWIRSTGKDETRKKRIEVALSKMHGGERRPCCWNRNLSTEPAVSKNGVLLVP
jgi:hypothetical protein